MEMVNDAQEFFAVGLEKMTITVCYTQQVPLKLQEYSMMTGKKMGKKNNKTG